MEGNWKMKKIKLAVLPGDGVGQDITLACMPVFAALNLPFDITFLDIGFDTWQQSGVALPLNTLKIINNSDAALIGAIKNHPRKNKFKNNSISKQNSKPSYISPFAKLNKVLDIFACVKPSKIKLKDLKELNCTIIHKNIPAYNHDLNPTNHLIKNNYLCRKHQSDQNWLITQYTKLFEFAFNYAEIKKSDSIILFNKIDSFAQQIFSSVASKYSSINYQILNQHSTLHSIKENIDNNVILSTSFHLQTSLDRYFSATANYGSNGSYFRPAHGSESHLKPYSISPTSMFISIALLLDHFDYQLESYCIKKGINNILKNQKYLTPDLGGKHSTLDLANVIIQEVNDLRMNRLFKN